MLIRLFEGSGVSVDENCESVYTLGRLVMLSACLDFIAKQGIQKIENPERSSA
jgi:hypothetical protein